jgi:AraC family transcriptional regulator
MTDLPLSRPPEIANAGIGVHGIGTRRDVFRLPEFWQLHLYRYSAEYFVDGVEYAIRPGSVSLVPPATTVEYRYHGRSDHLYVHFRADQDPEERGAARRAVPVVQDAGPALPLIDELLYRAATSYAAEPRRAEAQLWTALWRIAELSDARDADRGDPVVQAALEQIEKSLAEPLKVADLARRLGVSHNHLTRLFRTHTGETVVGHIQSRRMHRAHHLLMASTLPISTIAAAVGIPDLQAFNKACRRAFGASPRALRDRRSVDESP